MNNAWSGFLNELKKCTVEQSQRLAKKINHKHEDMVRLLEEQHKETNDAIIQLQNKTSSIEQVLSEVTTLKKQVN